MTSSAAIMKRMHVLGQKQLLYSRKCQIKRRNLGAYCSDRAHSAYKNATLVCLKATAQGISVKLDLEMMMKPEVMSILILV